MLESIEQIVTVINSWVWGWPMIIALFGCHIFLTIRLKFPQRKLLTGIKLSISGNSEGDASGDVSQFGALVTSLAATIGIGNIVGVATAISLGGPGAVMWCWMSGILGISTKYTESLLSMKYRTVGADGKMKGGPMYVIERGMGKKWLAILFAVFTVLAAMGIGSTVQSNAFAVVVEASTGIPRYASGIFISLSVACVLLFGVKGIANVCTRLIPFMTLLYVGGCIFLLFINGAYVWDAIKLIVTSAFTPQAAGGGFVGGAVMMAARYGIARGLFSNESGMGSAPIVAAAAKSRNPVRQALISSTGTFWDTVIICALTGIVLVSSIIIDPEIGSAQDGMLTELAFRRIPYVGTAILTVSLTTFSFSTILGWSYYSEKAVQYLGGKHLMYAFHLIWIVVIFLGAVLDLSLVWNIADVMNAFMAVPNLISLVALSGVAARETNYYLWSNNLDKSELPEDIR